MKKPLRNLLPVVPFEAEKLVSYAAVRQYFGWKDNATIRRYVSMGLLTRVRIGTRSKDCRITTASVVSLREHMNKCISDAEYAEKARMQTMRERKGLTQQKSEEVLLDAEEIIRNFNEGKGPTVKDTTPDVGSTYTPPPKPARPRTAFRLVRGI